MEQALSAAREAGGNGCVPVGAVVTGPGVQAVAGNGPGVMDHAELRAMQAAAAARGARYLSDCTLTVTLEPCAMCAGAIAAYRVGRLVFGAYDPKSGGVEHGARVFDHAHWKPETVGGVRDSECAALLREFFGERRA